MRQIKIFVSTSFLEKDKARKWGAILRSEGYDVVSHWTEHKGSEDDPEALAIDGEKNLADLSYADVILVLWPGRLGTSSEFGYAVGKGIPVIILKSPTEIIANPMAYVHGVKRAHSADSVMRLLAKMSVDRRWTAEAFYKGSNEAK
jgi:nucleoside 2-deoxyribosyltransferase